MKAGAIESQLNPVKAVQALLLAISIGRHKTTMDQLAFEADSSC